MRKLSQIWFDVQEVLFPFIEKEIDEPLTEKLKNLVTTLELIRIEEVVRVPKYWKGQSPKNRKQIARAFIAKAHYNMDPDYLIGVLTKMKELKAERDDAVATKTQISDKKTATALATAGAATRKLKALEKKYGDVSHCAVQGIKWLHQYFQKIDNFFPYSLIGTDLSKMSHEYGYEIKTVPNQKHKEVNSYHTDVIEIFKRHVEIGNLRPALEKHLKETA